MTTPGPAEPDKDQRFNAVASLTVGVIVLVTLIAVFFHFPTLTNDQRALAHFLIALAAALFAFFFTGAFHISGRYQSIVVRAGAGFAIFFAVYFLIKPFERATNEEGQKNDSANDLNLIGASDARILQLKATLKRLGRYHGPLDGEEDEELLKAVDKFRDDYEYLFPEPIVGSTKLSTSTNPTTSTLDPRTDAQAIAWVALSPEFQASARATYNAMLNFVSSEAGREFSALWPSDAKPIEDRNLPRAVLFDIDSATLDSSDFSARSSIAGEGFNSADWEQYILMASSRPIPGSLDAAKKLQALGIKPIYISMRTPNLREATMENLRRMGYPVDADGGNLLTRSDEMRTLESLRHYAAQSYRVVAIVGDSVDDFLDAPNDPNGLYIRQELVQRTSSRWGVGWFFIPNPIFSRSLSILTRSEDGRIPSFDEREQNLMRQLTKF